MILFCAVRHAARSYEPAEARRRPGGARPQNEVTLRAGGPATIWLPALLKQLESAVLDYQEDLVMPGSSPR